MISQNQVLICQTDDVRPFARLLRGIGLKHVRISNSFLSPTLSSGNPFNQQENL